jgi:hypothetical protein
VHELRPDEAIDRVVVSLGLSGVLLWIVYSGSCRPELSLPAFE